MSMKTIALLTNSEWSNLSTDHQLLIEPLKRHGFSPQPIVWDNKNTNWDNFDIIVIASAWGYYKKVEEYLELIVKIDKLNIPLWNPPNVIKWNVNKKYLLELKEKGASIVPTLLVTNKSSIKKIGEEILKNNWKEIILKPVFGGGGYNVLRGNINSFNIIKSYIQKFSLTSDIIIQPLMKEVIDEGEYSFIFIGGEYSHTIISIQSSRTLNVVRKYSTIKKVTPPKELIKQATDIYNLLPSTLLYARIDAVNINGKLCLMEAEINEPRLYFGMHPQSIEKFIQHLQS